MQTDGGGLIGGKMAGKRKKGERWEFCVKNSALLGKPLYLMFDTEAEGDEYCRRLEGLLARGIVPTEYQVQERTLTIGTLLRRYLTEHAGLKQNDKELLNALLDPLGKTSIAAIDANWVDAWVTRLKREDNLKPGTIRAKVGALARACDWGMRKKIIVMPDHPLRTLPVGYANYTEADAALAGGVKADEARERRLEPGEEAAIRKVLSVGVLERKQRAFTLEHPKALLLIFELAVETAMRMREMYTLTLNQIDLPKRTIWLDRTKNGDGRQVPLSSVAGRVLKQYIEAERPTSILFPWWNGKLDKHSLGRTTDSISYRWSQIFEAAGCGDLRFHDLRHEGTSRIVERTSLGMEEVMKITGHKTHSMMMRYLKLRGSDLAEKLW